MNRVDKRGEVVAFLGFGLSLLMAVLLGILALWTDASSVWATALYLLGTAGVWLLTLIQVHQQRLVAEERLELAELERGRREMLAGAQTIFDEEDLDQMEKLAMGRRLRAIERFLVPVVALLTAAYNIIVGAAILPWIKQLSFIASIAGTPIINATALLFFAGGISFVCFMISRYALGMSRLSDWSLLRAGANVMFGASAAALGIALAVLCVISGFDWVEVWWSRGIGFFMIVVGVETVFNFIFDFYRPRARGQIQRPFYDNRLLGMFSEPEGILRSLANAVDYQFGFKVSDTWFYRLLGRIVVPLLLVEAAVLLALTCIVVVPPGHKAIIEHLGTRVSVVPPGVHFTWCWPIDKATILPVETVQRLEIGFERGRQGEREMVEGAILWTKKHYKKEYLLLVADRGASMGKGTPAKDGSSSGAGGSAPPINVLSMNVSVQWRVGERDEDVLRFHAQANDVAAILESLAYRELTRYAAQADVLDLLGAGGIHAAEEIQSRLQTACDQAGYDGKGLGVRIMYLGIGGVHPPADEDVAKSYEDVVGAYEAKDGKIKQAQGDATSLRLMMAGTPWEKFYLAIAAEDAARTVGAADLPEKTAEVERLLRHLVGGEARSRASMAELQTLKRVFDVKSAAELYTMQRQAFDAAPEIYITRVCLKVLAEMLERIRKFVVVVDDSTKILYDLDLKPPQPVDIIGAEAASIDTRQQASP